LSYKGKLSCPCATDAYRHRSSSSESALLVHGSRPLSCTTNLVALIGRTIALEGRSAHDHHCRRGRRARSRPARRDGGDVVSLPMKIIFFVLADGWRLVSGSLVQSIAVYG
jgi:hypothetical protein